MIFFNIFNEIKLNNSDKVINIEIVAKWLNIQNHKLRETLIKSYKDGIDYKIEKVNKKIGKGGQTKKIFYITSNCFKKICQLTKSKKGNEVREYFIQVESLLYKYKDYIIDGMKEKITKLEKNQKPKINPDKGVIYIFQTPNSKDNSLYKIGRTKDLKKRLKSHESPLSHDIDVLFYYENRKMYKIINERLSI